MPEHDAWQATMLGLANGGGGEKFLAGFFDHFFFRIPASCSFLLLFRNIFRMPFTISGESKKAQIAARYVGVELVSGAVKSSYGPKHDVALDTPEGAIFESSAVARYIARLRPDVGL